MVEEKAYQVVKEVGKKRKMFRSEKAWFIGMAFGLSFCFLKMVAKAFPLTEALGFIVAMCGFWFAKRAAYHHKSFNMYAED